MLCKILAFFILPCLVISFKLDMKPAFTGKVENIDRSRKNSTSAGCETIHGAEPDENCLYHVGDMIFTQEELLALYGKTKNGINLPNHRWPGNSVVKGQLPYAFDRNKITVGSDEEKFINRVIKRFNMDLEGCLRIVPRTTESDYVKVGKLSDTGNICNSQVGDVPWKVQELNLDGTVGGGCYSDRTVVHEFIHAWGFTHEQNRPDRNSFVKINFANIEGHIPGEEDPNFDIQSNYLTYGVQYNGLSVMHYGSDYFSKQQGFPTIISKRPELFTNNQMGTNDWMTLGDVSKLRQMYGCDTGSCQNDYSVCQEYADLGYCERPSRILSIMQNVCKSSCNTCNGVCKDKIPTSTCQRYAKREDVSCYQDKADKIYVEYMQKNCRKTCDFCAADCKDNAKDVAKCPEYKEDGYCQSNHVNFEYMQRNCRRTCNFCFGQNSRMDTNDANLELPFLKLKMELNDGDDTELPELPIPDIKREQELKELPLDSKLSNI